MVECIERKAFLDAIERMKPYHQDADDIAEMLQNFPAADVRPVVRGKWKETLFGWECTACGKEQQYARRLKYCPNCGAMMEEI